MAAQNTQPKETLLQIGRKLYLNEELADIHFIFMSTEGLYDRIPAHKTLLGAATDVFRAMFNSLWTETGLTEVEIVDASPTAFKEFLQFFYLMNPSVTMDNVHEVMNLAKKYEVAECFDTCAELLEENLRHDNAIWTYELAVHLEHEHLVEFCYEFMKSNLQEVLASAGFLSCDRGTVKRILQMDSFSCTEVVCFEALMKWMKNEYGQENLTKEIVHYDAGELLHEIRFRSMSREDFFGVCTLYETIFTPEELNEITQMMSSSQFRPIIFKGNRRAKFLYHWNDGAVMLFETDRVGRGGTFTLKTIESTKFTVSKTALLGAVRCIAVDIVGLDTIPTTIQVIQAPDAFNSKEILYTGRGRLQDGRVERVSLSKPILLQPEHIYEVHVLFSLVGTLYTHCYLKSVKRTVEDISVQFYHNQLSDNDVNGFVHAVELNRV